MPVVVLVALVVAAAVKAAHVAVVPCDVASCCYCCLF